MSFSSQIFKLGYEISPVILVNGIASQIPGQMLPIVAITQAGDFTTGLLSGDAVPPSLDNYFAHWKPLPGTTMVSSQVGMYPFANQAVAGNAIIAQPLNISMLMNCPVQTAGGYTGKLATLTVLAQILAAHNAQGGTYTVVTPSQYYPNCILTLMRDVSGGESKQVQHTWQFDFTQPLITLNAAAQVLNGLMSKINDGLPTGQFPQWSGPGATVGQLTPTTAIGTTSAFNFSM